MELLSHFISIHGNTKSILLLALILSAGFLMTRVTKLAKMPHVTGYLFAGIAIGPSVLGWVDLTTLQSLEFMTDIALAIIAFSVGKFLRLSELKSNGIKSVGLTLFESLSALIAVTLLMRLIFGLSWPFCLLLGVIGSTSSSASTLMTIRQYHAKGPFVDMILQVTALNNAFALIAFNVVAAFLSAIDTGHLSLFQLIVPLIQNFISIALGFGLAFLLKYLIAKRNSDDHRLVVLMISIVGLAGACSALSVSPLLACMVLGGTYRNISDDEQLFRLLNFFAPPVLLIFFVVSGMKLNLQMVRATGIMGVAYFFIRIAGKYLGVFAGSTVMKLDSQIRNYLGMALTPQAGVSIGLAALGQRLLPPDMALLLNTIILSSAVLYEMTGPALAKASLFMSGAMTKDDN
ncbi:MAG: cation:proton antiporter [Spirochaetales bacterium]|nr:cation:proton antiporter [Spirochaetales bacterium]